MNKQDNIKNIQWFKKNFKKKIEGLEVERDERIQEILDKHIKEHAKFKVGDFLRAEKINFFIKVEHIDAKFYDWDGGSISIYYYGYPYKKLNGQLVRTKFNELECLSHPILINVDENNMVL